MNSMLGNKIFQHFAKPLTTSNRYHMCFMIVFDVLHSALYDRDAWQQNSSIDDSCVSVI